MGWVLMGSNGFEWANIFAKLNLNGFKWINLKHIGTSEVRGFHFNLRLLKNIEKRIINRQAQINKLDCLIKLLKGPIPQQVFKIKMLFQ